MAMKKRTKPALVEQFGADLRIDIDQQTSRTMTDGKEVLKELWRFWRESRSP
jgi:hypothetical protein